MNRTLQFTFRPGVPIRDVEETLLLAAFAVEGLLGRVRVAMDASFDVDPGTSSVSINEGNVVGWLMARIFAAFLSREFGETAFIVNRTSHSQRSAAPQREEAKR